jgi:hypothetical protein
MSNQNNRSGSSDASSNTPAKDGQGSKTGGNMGAGRSGNESLGSEKPSERDNMGSRKPAGSQDKGKDK